MCVCKVEDDGELFYSLDDGNTRFSDLLQLVEFYQLNRGVLPCKLKHHCARTTLWTNVNPPSNHPLSCQFGLWIPPKPSTPRPQQPCSKPKLLNPAPCTSTNPDVHLWPLYDLTTHIYRVTLDESPAHIVPWTENSNRLFLSSFNVHSYVKLLL